MNTEYKETDFGLGESFEDEYVDINEEKDRIDLSDIDMKFTTRNKDKKMSKLGLRPKLSVVNADTDNNNIIEDKQRISYLETFNSNSSDEMGDRMSNYMEKIEEGEKIDIPFNFRANSNSSIFSNNQGSFLKFKETQSSLKNQY